ncbi:ATP-binding protein [Candidatus Margulisiibacteriota bacterium]
MIKRHISEIIGRYSKEYPILAIVGPRQSGKTTLAKYLFPNYQYFSLENIDIRQRAESDPRGFLSDCGNRVILDEIQKVPELFSYLQQLVDDDQTPGQYILTGSQQFLLMEKISQSLAGRIATFHLYPFTMRELFECKPLSNPKEMLLTKEECLIDGSVNVYNCIFTGLYPRIHDKKLTPRKWLEEYINTYVERDVRAMANIGDLRLFETFLKLCAGRSGQLINYAAISNACGVSQPTVKRWLTLLEISGLIFQLKPYYKNLNKRMIKTPKLFFIDTGLLCFLLSIRSPEELQYHPLFGNIFETFIISEIYKQFSCFGEQAPLYFWRDKTGNEIDLLIDIYPTVLPIEIKSSRTWNKDFKAGILKWFSLSKAAKKRGLVLYDGEQIVDKKGEITSLPWWRFL